MASSNSKELLLLEHRSKEAHLERLLASRTKPPIIERLNSSVLQDVQRFLPLMRQANEKLESEPSSNSQTSNSSAELCCEVGEDFDGPAIEMNLMLASDEQVQMIADMETGAGGNNVSESEDSESDSSSEEDDDRSEQVRKQKTHQKSTTTAGISEVQLSSNAPPNNEQAVTPSVTVHS